MLIIQTTVILWHNTGTILQYLNKCYDPYRTTASYWNVNLIITTVSLWTLQMYWFIEKNSKNYYFAFFLVLCKTSQHLKLCRVLTSLWFPHVKKSLYCKHIRVQEIELQEMICYIKMRLYNLQCSDVCCIVYYWDHRHTVAVISHLR